MNGCFDTPRRERRARLLWLVLAAVIAAPASAGGKPAATRHPTTGRAPAGKRREAGARLLGQIPFGIGDASPWMFADPRFRWLRVRYARLVVAWDVVEHRPALRGVTTWLTAARAAGVHPLIAFDHGISHYRRLPSLAAYARDTRLFIARYRWVRDYQPWNEENEGSEPTARHPQQAARLFTALRGECRYCTVTAADLLDGPSLVPWVRRFRQRAPGSHLWGLHPYYELSYGKHSYIHHATIGTLERLVGGPIWLTETGNPVWYFLRPARVFVVSRLSRQALATRRLLPLVRANRRIQRVYFYQWRNRTPLSQSQAQFARKQKVTVTWDSGLFGPDCRARPAFAILARALGRTGPPPRVTRTEQGWACQAPARPRPNGSH